VRALAEERKERDGLSVTVRVPGEEDGTAAVPPRLPAAVEEHLLRIIQEALHNVSKHAGTGSAVVELDFRSDPLRITIADQGVGFDAQRPSAPAGHLGLTSMAERAQALGGRLAIESRPGAGTRIMIECPRAEEQAHA
jgi:signal transduction histidine kinase